MEAGLDLDTTWFISIDRVRCLEVGGNRGVGSESSVREVCRRPRPDSSAQSYKAEDRLRPRPFSPVISSPYSTLSSSLRSQRGPGYINQKRKGEDDLCITYINFKEKEQCGLRLYPSLEISCFSLQATVKVSIIEDVSEHHI